MEIKKLIKTKCHEDFKVLIQAAINYVDEQVECGSNSIKKLASFIVADMILNSEDYYKKYYDAEDIFASILANFEVDDLEIYPKKIRDALYILRGFNIVKKKKEGDKRGYLLNVDFILELQD